MTGFFRYGLTAVLLAVFSILPSAMLGQSQQELENQRKKIEDEIRYVNKLLDETRKSKEATVYELKLIARKSDQRKKLIATLEKELAALNRKISLTEEGIDELNDELSALKEEYAKVAYFAYRHKPAYSKLIFLFSAKDFNQAYQRLRYLDQIAAFIRSEAEKIRQLESEKEAELSKLKQQKAEKRPCWMRNLCS